MKPHERGAYLDLLVFAWRDRSVSNLPDDDDELATMLGISQFKWRGMKEESHGHEWELERRALFPEETAVSAPGCRKTIGQKKCSF